MRSRSPGSRFRTGRSMTARLVWASLTRRFRQLALIALAVALAAGTVATLAGFSGRASEGLEDELAAFGPNLVVRPQVAGPPTLLAAEADRIRELPGVTAAAGWTELEPEALSSWALSSWEATFSVERSVLEVHPGWTLEGSWPGPGQALLGAELDLETRLADLAISGRLDTGGTHDSAVFLGAPPAGSRRIDSRPVGFQRIGFQRIEVRTERGRLDEVAAAIEARIAGAEARPVRRVSLAEAGLIRRLTLVLGAVSAVAVALALISVIAATTALMEVRRSEMGLLMALGYTGRRVAALFAFELVSAALLAALAGAAAGELAARALATRLLDGALQAPLFTWGGPLAAALAALVVVGGSLALAVRRSGHLDPARLLRGA